MSPRRLGYKVSDDGGSIHECPFYHKFYFTKLNQRWQQIAVRGQWTHLIPSKLLMGPRLFLGLEGGL